MERRSRNKLWASNVRMFSKYCGWNPKDLGIRKQRKRQRKQHSIVEGMFTFPRLWPTSGSALDCCQPGRAFSAVEGVYPESTTQVDNKPLENGTGKRSFQRPQNCRQRDRSRMHLPHPPGEQIANILGNGSFASAKKAKNESPAPYLYEYK